MKMRVETVKDTLGRIRTVKVFKGGRRKPLLIDYLYDGTGVLKAFDFKGRREEMPSVPELVSLINQEFMERLGTIQNIERIGNIVNTPLHGRVLSEERNFIERWEYFVDSTRRRDWFFNRYTGRSYPLSPVWKSGIGTDPSKWQVPLFLLKDITAEGPWGNTIHMRNSKDGVTVDEIYIQPRMVFSPPCLMKIVTKFPVTVPGGNALPIGFEVNSQGGAAIYQFVRDGDKYYIRSTCFTPTARDYQNLEVTPTTPTTYQEYWLDYDPPNLRLWQYIAGTPTLLGTVTINSGPSAFDFVSPFITNENTVVVSDWYVSHWAVWQRTPAVQEVHQHSDTYKYKALPHDTLTVVWDPAAGNTLHLSSLILSVEDAGTLTLYEDAAIIHVFLIKEKKTVPIPLGIRAKLSKDGVLQAKFVGDAGAPASYITAVGHEHTY